MKLIWMIVFGIDLAGSEKRNTGVAVLKGKKFAYIGIAHTDDEIIGLIKKLKPEIVAMDAPLTLPKGRKSIDVRDKNHFRECDVQLRNLGIRFFPITLGPMRMLVKRGILLKKKIQECKVKVIEVFPGASYDIWKTSRRDKQEILKLFRKFGFKLEKRAYTQDELDGMCCAATGRLVLNGKAVPLEGSDGCIWVPLYSRGSLEK